MSFITDRAALEIVAGIAAATAASAGRDAYEEAAYRLGEALTVAAPGLSRVERLILLVHCAFDCETDRDVATIACLAAKDELHALGRALGGIAESAAAFRSAPWEIVVAGLDLDPD